MLDSAANNQGVDDEIAFWRGFITWWACQKGTPVPARAWEALEFAQHRAGSLRDCQSH
jgi:hypothetical protein